MNGALRAWVARRTNERVAALIEDAPALGIRVALGPGGATVLDCGVSTSGSWEAGRRVSILAHGGLMDARLGVTELGGIVLPEFVGDSWSPADSAYGLQVSLPLCEVDPAVRISGPIRERLADVRVEVEGFLSGPSFHRPSRVLQHLYVNNRHIEYRNLGFLLTKAYEAMLRRGEYPAAFIFITVEPSLVDVNVHPAKREVRFFDQSYINGLIINLARKALGSRAHRVDTDLFSGDASQTRPAGPDDTATEQDSALNLSSGTNASRGERSTPLFASGDAAVVSDGRALYEALESGAPSVLGVIFDTYILAEDPEGLVIIDYHAAHERFIYDRLMADAGESGTQGLIFPHALELAPHECAAVLENLDRIAGAGFQVEEIGEGALAVRGVPPAASGIDLDAFFQDLIHSIDSAPGKERDARWKTLIAEKAACHSAKRAGDGLSRADAAALAREALSGAHELRCPHGRPYLYRLGKDDIEKLFKRK